jgi:hypothetical protein
MTNSKKIVFLLGFLVVCLIGIFNLKQASEDFHLRKKHNSLTAYWTQPYVAPGKDCEIKCIESKGVVCGLYQRVCCANSARCIKSENPLYLNQEFCVESRAVSIKTSLAGVYSWDTECSVARNNITLPADFNVTAAV